MCVVSFPLPHLSLSLSVSPTHAPHFQCQMFGASFVSLGAAELQTADTTRADGTSLAAREWL